MKSEKKYLLMVFAGVLIFSTFEVVTKTMNGVLAGTALTFYRFLIGGLVLLPSAVMELKKLKAGFSLKEKTVLCALSFMLVAVSMTLSQYGIFLSSANISAILFSINPLFISLFAWLLLKEPLAKNKILGLIIGIIGLVVTCFRFMTTDEFDNKYILGVVLTFASMLIFSVYTVLNKKWIIPKIGSIASTSLVSIVGALWMLPIITAQSIIKGTNVFAFPIFDIMPQFLYCSIVGTGLAYLLYFGGLANVQTSTGSIIFLIKPPMAALFAGIFLGEKITLNIAVGIIIILMGMFIACKDFNDDLLHLSERYRNIGQ